MPWTSSIPKQRPRFFEQSGKAVGLVIPERDSLWFIAEDPAFAALETFAFRSLHKLARAAEAVTGVELSRRKRRALERWRDGSPRFDVPTSNFAQEHRS